LWIVRILWRSSDSLRSGVNVLDSCGEQLDGPVSVLPIEQSGGFDNEDQGGAILEGRAAEEVLVAVLFSSPRLGVVDDLLLDIKLSGSAL
jgi:hypothetical protein